MTASLPWSSWPRFSPPASGSCLSTDMSVAGAGVATEVCDAMLLSIRARHTFECVPCTVLASGTAHRDTELLHHRISDVQPASGWAVIGVFAMSSHHLAAVVLQLAALLRLLPSQLLVPLMLGLQTLQCG